MSPLFAFLLGFLQGLTEFVPVSSTAHLLLGQHLFGLPADEAMFSFVVIVQLGTLVSLFAFYWKDLRQIVQATTHSIPAIFQRIQGAPTPFFDLNARLGWLLLLATLPALLAGYLLKDIIEALFRLPLLEAAIRLFTAALLMELAERFGKRQRTLETLTWVDALVIGGFQVLSVFPGASRSGTTISGGMLRGLDRPAAARFAFLLSTPVMLTAGIYEMLDVLQMPNLGDFLLPLSIGFLTAAVSGWLAIKWLLNFLNQHSLHTFAIYCSVLGLIVLLIQVV
ncbi:MAG: undecaprenyl-diphosphatase UppP [Anaerolineales bacterium]|nr:undecaprenyl-diphosphatase UppP [Anaerolineales bacterium]MDW8228020.1 undecaprenyl-diphosphatase UppP [Anaerolineales bacterium]